jgi:hypothetical protein
MSELTVISLGWGLQSTTLAFMSALGELPKVDFVIHSDTTHERAATYQYAEQWAPWLEERGIPVITASDPAAAGQIVAPDGGLFAPVYTTQESGGAGQLMRTCTQRWKIAPMRRWLSGVMEERSISKTPGAVELWLGISLDEWSRAKTSDVAYITHRFPLLERRMSRQDCLDWLTAHDLPSPGKSACHFCPYHSATYWQQMKRENGPDWHAAIAVDAAIRHKRPGYESFVHNSRKPLEQAVVIPEDFGASQLELLDIDESVPCDSGHCFL